MLVKKTRKNRVKLNLAKAISAIIVLTLVSCDAEEVERDFTVSYDEITISNFASGANVHDPSVVQDGDSFYIFGSHMANAVSKDLKMWKYIGNGYQAINPVYDNIFAENLGIFDYAGSKDSAVPTDDGGYHVWAPDVIYNKSMEKYLMYVSITSTWNTSNIALMSSDNIEGPFTFEKNIIYSGLTPQTITKTNALDIVEKAHAEKFYFKNDNTYNFDDFPNAIDPTVFYDKDGKLWMVYGSWSGGMFLLELDEKTGEPIHPEINLEKRVDPYFGKKILGGGHKSMEGPYILYYPETDYYYLFLSYGGLAREGGYQMRVFRSKTVNGDYEDMNGKFPLKADDHSKFGLKLSGNYNLPSLKMAYMATGHNSVVVDQRDGKIYNVFHTRFDNNGENHQVRVHQLAMNEDAWPVMLPYRTDGENLSDEIAEEDILGRYFFIDQGLKIDSEISEPKVVYLDKKGKLHGEDFSGTWSFSADNNQISFEVDNTELKGCITHMKDEAGTKVLAISVVGANKSIWAVKY